MLCFEVHDNGRGIHNIESTGQFFGNLNVVDNVNQNGIGFGIKIAKELTGLLGGKIIFKNIHKSMTIASNNIE